MSKEPTPWQEMIAAAHAAEIVLSSIVCALRLDQSDAGDAARRCAAALRSALDRIEGRTPRTVEVARTFVVERGLPMKNSGTPRKKIYPFHEMQPGDSFLVAHETGIAPNTMRSRVISAARKRGLKVATRKVPEGIRVWLVDGGDDARH